MTQHPVVDLPADLAASGWVFEKGGRSIARSLRFRDFAEAFAFMTRAAAAAEAMNHHPDWSNSWNRVEVRLTSHDTGCVSARDIALARAMEALI